MTDINKLIEEDKRLAIKDRCSYYHHSDDPTYAYREGYESGIDKGVEIILHHYRWRKVGEELPEDNEALILKTESKLTTQPVLIKTIGGGLFVDYRIKTIHENLDGWVEFWNWTRFNNNQVTEWKPIE